MNTAYTEGQYDSNYPDGVERHWWNVSRNALVAKLVGWSGQASGRWLEVGCGRGIVVADLRRQGIDCDGIELASAIPLEPARPYVRTGQDALDVPEYERVKYTGLLLLDVIEHVPDAVSFVRMLLEAYPGISCVIVTVPARSEIWSNYDLEYGHFRRYSLDLLGDELAVAGLSVRDRSYFFRAPYWVARWMKFIGIERATRMVSPSRGLASIAHRLLGGLMLLDMRLLKPFRHGSSAYAVCRRG